MIQATNLNAHYGLSHVLQGVSLTLKNKNIFALIGRNGMGKTTFCNTIMGLVPITSGDIKINKSSINGLRTDQITHLGVGYVPQGRRIWPSLTVNEHLKLVERKTGAWNREKIYTTFPLLAKRKNNGGDQLSGGEQQILSIARALLVNPKLLIMDEPTEGLSPIMVRQIEKLLVDLAKNKNLTILLIEQNLEVALNVSERIAIMVNGRIGTEMSTSKFKKDKIKQQKLLGMRF